MGETEGEAFDLRFLKHWGEVVSSGRTRGPHGARLLRVVGHDSSSLKSAKELIIPPQKYD